jgi:hypothetical protein
MKDNIFTRPIEQLEMSEPEAGRTVKKASKQSRKRGRRRVPGITACHQCQGRRMRDQANTRGQHGAPLAGRSTASLPVRGNQVKRRWARGKRECFFSSSFDQREIRGLTALEHLTATALEFWIE